MCVRVYNNSQIIPPLLKKKKNHIVYRNIKLLYKYDDYHISFNTGTILLLINSFAFCISAFLYICLKGLLLKYSSTTK